MLTNVHLYGSLAEKYGALHSFDIANAGQAARALAANHKGFAADLQNGLFEVRIGDTHIDADSLQLRIGKGKGVHIIPAVQGSKNGGGVKLIAGLLLLTVATAGAASFAAGAVEAGFAAGANGFGALVIAGVPITYGSIASAGLMMTLQGISGLLTPTPKADYSTRNPVDQRASFLFNGATNTSAEGTAIPLVYGVFRRGSVIASAGIEVERLLGT